MTLADDEAVLAALDSGKLHSYVTDFPTVETKSHPNVIALPHLGASTAEAEENCAIMVADQIKDFLENGNIKNSVNFPAAELERNGGSRILIGNRNVPNMVSQISTVLAAEGLNIDNMLNKKRDDIAYNIIDVDSDKINDSVKEKLLAIDGIFMVRLINA